MPQAANKKQTRQYNDLHRAKARVLEGKKRIARQKALIAELRVSGQPTQQAEAMLKSIERSHLEMQNHGVILSALLRPGVD